MGTAIVVAIVSGIVSLVSVLLNAFITTANLRAESKRARDVREDEAKRRQDDRDAEAARRASDSEAEAARSTASEREGRVQARWSAVRAVLDSEAFVRTNKNWQSAIAYRSLVQQLSLLTRPEEANLRAALKKRADALDLSKDHFLTVAEPAWWYPWVSSWAESPDEAMINGDSDLGRAF